MRRHFLALIGALALGAVTGAAAVATEPKAGVEYLVLPEKQNTDAGPKIEVTEFFAYYCPHCNAFEPQLAAWVKKQGDKIVFKRVHIGLNPSVAPQQRLFYTLEAMGLLEQYHTKVFAAMHEQKQRLNTDEAVFAWAEQAGIPRAKFIDTYRSFGMQAKINRAASMMEAYRIESWPMIAIDGHYLTSPYQAGQGGPAGATEKDQQQAALVVMDHLLAKAKAEKR
jgi:thiol:disulfide interchange protein DsbA